MINWWNVNFSENQAITLADTLRKKHVSQGAVTRLLENKIAEKFSCLDCICVSSGTSALLVSMIAAGVGPGKEVIVPNRTWIATAHAAKMLGADVVVCETLNEYPIMDVTRIEKLITDKTVAIVPVYLNGRNILGFEKLIELANNNSIAIIEDAAQAIGSLDNNGQQLGSKGNFGCFSLSVAKLVGSGQGGFILTNDAKYSKIMRNIRTHGLESTNEPTIWSSLGGNFRFNDLAASLVFDQLDELNDRIQRVTNIYDQYKNKLKNITELIPIPVKIELGEVPVYSEYLIKNRDDFQLYLLKNNIETRKSYPDISSANYITKSIIKNTKFESEGICLPCGPDLNDNDLEYVINKIKQYFNKND